METFIFYDKRDGEWTVSHNGKLYSDLVAMHETCIEHADADIRAFGEICWILNVTGTQPTDSPNMVDLSMTLFNDANHR